MDIVTGFIFLVLFIAIYGSFIGLAWLIDTLLFEKFGKGIFPAGYFKSEKGSWKKW